MKTAEEWTACINGMISRQDGFPLMDSEYTGVFKQAQLDAWKQGMKLAAELASFHPAANTLTSNDWNEFLKGRLHASKEILTYVDNLRELPKQ